MSALLSPLARRRAARRRRDAARLVVDLTGHAAWLADLGTTRLINDLKQMPAAADWPSTAAGATQTTPLNRSERS